MNRESESGSICGPKGNQPLVDGGLVISPDDYMSFLAVIVDGGKDYLTRDTLHQQSRRSFNETTVISPSPYLKMGENFEYGLGLWRECSPKECSDTPRISSAGAFGFYPWIDRENGHYAVLAVVEGFGFSQKSYRFLKHIRGDLLKIASSCGNRKERKSFP
jgi:CubicO group peptidase (beta-lactamase class C family)